ncbi:MAG: post-transcriptional regulator [Bacilli bacterium]|nr:post-transcriptional regulator [Bacilli bacterium]
MDIKFNSVEELYNRLRPALNTKRNEMIRKKYHYIKSEDIWNYLKDNKWINSRNLSLSDMVDDILSSNDEAIDEYVKNKLREQSKEAVLSNLEGIL